MPDIKTTSTEQKLGSGPAGQPHTGTKKPTLLGSSTQTPLKTGSPIPVAQFGAHATGGGEKPMSTSTAMPLSRTATHPYQDKKFSPTTPLTSGKGKRK